jgi:four helix bundle protein
VTIALGSQGELETCIEISHRLGFLPVAERTAWLEECATVGRLLNGLYRALERKLQQQVQ